MEALDLIILGIIDLTIFAVIYRNVNKQTRIVPQRYIRPTPRVYSGDILDAIKANQKLYTISLN